MDYIFNDSVKSNNNFYEKNFGFTSADLLILEIKKKNRPIIQKNDFLLRKSSAVVKSNICPIDEQIYKNPKVRKNI